MLNGLVDRPRALSIAIFPKPALFMVFASAGGGDPQQSLQSLKSALADVPTADVQTAQEYKDTTINMVNQLLNLLYALLALSVLISLFGIVNTLVLAVYERTREIGLVRAIGMSRRQVRATVRYESVITSVIGAIMGIVVGVVFAWVVTARFGGTGDHVLHPRRPAGRLPRRGRRRRRDRRHPAGAAGGTHRHPRGDPLRVS